MEVMHALRRASSIEVLPRAAAMVCHGGYATTVGALAHGVPQVVVPVFADQGRNARRVAEIGAGIALPEPASILAPPRTRPTPWQGSATSCGACWTSRPTAGRRATW